MFILGHLENIAKINEIENLHSSNIMYLKTLSL
jgi:hypothetical protein